MPPAWLSAVAWVSLALSFACAAAILYDLFGRGHRQQMAIMDAVWPVTALYLGPLAWPAYVRWGRSSTSRSPSCWGSQSSTPRSRPCAASAPPPACARRSKPTRCRWSPSRWGSSAGWAVMQLVLFPDPHLTPDHAAYWMLMQVPMLLGFLTSYPANVWLVRRDLREAM